MTLTAKDLQSIQVTLKPGFDKIHAEAKTNYEKLNRKIESLRRSNRKDHNIIIDLFDKRDLKLQARVQKLENKQVFPAFKNL